MSRPPQPKTTLTIIGGGRLGTALGRALGSSGFRIGAVITRHAKTAKAAANLIPGYPRALAITTLGSFTPSERVIVAVPDDQIEAVTCQILELKNFQKPGVILNTSGALGSDVFNPLVKFGWHAGSMHPLVSVSDPRVGANQLHGSFWCLEGDARSLRMARNLVRALSGRSFSIRPEMKPLYHAAAVMASGSVVSLFEVAIEMLSKCGLTRIEARRILQPLVESTVANLKKSETAKALTGPFARGDEDTIDRHLEALRGSDLDLALLLYRLLGQRSLELAAKQKTDKNSLRHISRKLQP